MNDYLRLMYARIGVPHCPVCHKEIRLDTISARSHILIRRERNLVHLRLRPHHLFHFIQPPRYARSALSL